MPPIKSQVAPRTYIVAFCFLAIFFVTPGVIIFVKSRDPNLLYIVAGVAVLIFVNLRFIRFECTEYYINYHSLFKHLSIRIEDVTGVRIGRLDIGKRAPMFILYTEARGKIPLLLRSLPIADVRRFAAYLAGRGIPFSVDNTFMAKRMAAQIFPEGISN